MDALDGFRGAHIEDDASNEERLLAEAEKALLQEHPGIDLELIRAVRVGVETQQFIQQSPAGKYLFTRCMTTIQTAVETWLGQADSAQAAEAHFNAKVANTILDWLNDALREGKEAEQQLLEEDHGQE